METLETCLLENEFNFEKIFLTSALFVKVKSLRIRLCFSSKNYHNNGASFSSPKIF